MKSSVSTDGHTGLSMHHTDLSQSCSEIKDWTPSANSFQLLFVSSFVLFSSFMGKCAMITLTTVKIKLLFFDFWRLKMKAFLVSSIRICFWVHSSQRKFKNLKWAACIEFIMTKLGIHEDKVPIVAYSLHIEVGVGFPCLDCAFLTSCEACSWETSSKLFMNQRRAAHWFYSCHSPHTNGMSNVLQLGPKQFDFYWNYKLQLQS